MSSVCSGSGNQGIDRPLTASIASRTSSEGELARAISGQAEPLEEANVAEVMAWCLTGMSGWWSLNIITAELPFFVAELPQHQKLGNLLAVCTQLGNVAPIFYKTLTRNRPANLAFVIGLFQFVGVAALIICAVFWRYTPLLLLCTGCAGSVGCMSSVTYWAAAAQRPDNCVRAMSVGMTLGGLLASGFSALQLAGRQRGDARFTPFAYFLAAAAMQALQGSVFLARVWNRPQTEAPAAEQGEEGREVGAAKASLPMIAKLLSAGCFLVYAATYTMPTLQPFMAAGYSSETERQQLLLLMLILQNAGDVCGRLATVLVTGSPLVVMVWFTLLTASFCVAIFTATEHDLIANWISYPTAVILLPAVCTVYYFSRGLLVTTFYLFAKRKLGSKDLVQRASVNMGFLGQMGALLANAVAFTVVSILSS
eukprot:TRINITY_DN41525_c0_g1_i1.p1 TRINITY_DN41525_c0_g1~~TRINITY_DN41525_c0_g1_i1.p1  ORF type:complete len:425 (-),score=50.02 TRINITY_DN41525_c0_g1_i1:332-1606(-)